MTKRIGYAAIAASAMLAGCDDGIEAPAPKAAPMTIRNDYHDRMLRLDTLPRDAALRRAIRTTGARCDRVEASAFQQDHANLKMWTARCQTNAYAVFLAANGDVQVRNCTDVAALGLPTCRIPEASTTGRGV